MKKNNSGTTADAAINRTVVGTSNSTTDSTATTLPFNLKNMTDLVIAYESYRKLEQSIQLFTGFIPENPILEGLRHIDEIILDTSLVFDGIDEDLEYETFAKLMDDAVMGAEEKAEILMGMIPANAALPVPTL